MVAHFGWFLRVCVYVVFCGQQFLARPTLPTMFKIDIGSAKMANFCARKEKMHHQTTQISKHVQSSHGVRIFQMS